MPPKKSDRSNSSSSPLGFEAKLWLAADKLRNNMDAAEYKHVVLGLIFLKYISDSFEEHHAKLTAGEGDFAGANPEDPDEYSAENIFWVPPAARWSYLQSSAKQPTIGKSVDDAMVAIERDNSRLKGVLPKDYARPALDKHRLGELIDLIGTIGLGDKESRTKDILGRVYEYFLTQFASAEGKNGGQFYTPSCVVRLLVEMLAPYKGRIYDSACGSGGMFVQSEKFVESHGGKLGDISIYGQESNATTRRLAIMNLAIRGIEADFGPEHADTFRRDLHPDLRADYVLANPPFNDSDWFRKDDDVRWQFGVPPKGNANFAWVQHFIHHLAPQGMAGFVLANLSLGSKDANESEIRRQMVQTDLVDCIVALPDKLFYSIPYKVCLWFLAKKKSQPHRQGRVLFIDAQKFGTMTDKTHRELTEHDINQITLAYRAWRGDAKSGSYRDIPGFCKAASLADIKAESYYLMPSRYVAREDGEFDVEGGSPDDISAIAEAFSKSGSVVAKLHQEAAATLRLFTETHQSPNSGAASKLWPCRILSELAEINPRRDRSLEREDDAPTSFVPMAAVNGELGVIDKPDIRPFSEIRRGYTYFQEGDVLFAKITPCMENGKHAIARDLVGGFGFGSTEFHVVRCGEAILAEWLLLFLRQPEVLQNATTYFTGTAGQQRVPVSYLETLSVPVPPIETQRLVIAELERLRRAVRAMESAVAILHSATDASLPALLLGQWKFQQPKD